MDKFRPMLACNVENSYNVHFPVLASPKYDGIRALVRDGHLVSRTLKPISNHFTRNRFSHQDLNGCDGELIFGDPTKAGVGYRTNSAVSTEEGEPEIHYYIFDNVSHKGFKDRCSDAAEVVSRWKALHSNDSVVLVTQTLIENRGDLERFEDEHVSAGYEGICIRSVDGPYKMGRSTLKEGYLLKMKRFNDSEAIILGLDEEMHNDNEATMDARGYTKRQSRKANKVGKGTLGSLFVRDVHTGVEFNLGSGLDVDLSKEIWDHPEKYIGQMIKYKYTPYGVKDRPKHPVFLSFRSGDDL